MKINKPHNEFTPYQGVRTPKIVAKGISELAAELACSPSTIYSIKRTGALNDAIISQIGRKVVYDVERARYLANEYQKEKRQLK